MGFEKSRFFHHRQKLSPSLDEELSLASSTQFSTDSSETTCYLLVSTTRCYSNPRTVGNSSGKYIHMDIISSWMKYSSSIDFDGLPSRRESHRGRSNGIRFVATCPWIRVFERTGSRGNENLPPYTRRPKTKSLGIHDWREGNRAKSRSARRIKPFDTSLEAPWTTLQDRFPLTILWEHYFASREGKTPRHCSKLDLCRPLESIISTAVDLIDVLASCESD